MSERVRKRAFKKQFLDEGVTASGQKRAGRVRDAIVQEDPSILTALDEDGEFPNSQDAYNIAEKMVKTPAKEC